MNILSIYFTGSNSTKYVTDSIKNKCSNYHNIDEINIGDRSTYLSNNAFDKYDMFIIGGPIYIEVYPKILVNFIKKNLVSIENKKIILFQCAGGEKPPGMYELFKFLSKKNKVVGMTSFEMPNNFYMNGMFEYTEDYERSKQIKKANYKISKLCQVINGEKDKFCDYKLEPKKYYICRILYNILDGVYLKTYAKVHFNSGICCTGCSVCKKQCPTNNIKVDKTKKTISFGKNCTACTRCIHICPFEAILYKNKKIRKMNKL